MFVKPSAPSTSWMINGARFYMIPLFTETEITGHSVSGSQVMVTPRQPSV